MLDVCDEHPGAHWEVEAVGEEVHPHRGVLGEGDEPVVCLDEPPYLLPNLCVSRVPREEARTALAPVDAGDLGHGVHQVADDGVEHPEGGGPDGTRVAVGLLGGHRELLPYLRPILGVVASGKRGDSSVQGRAGAGLRHVDLIRTV